MSSGWIVYLYVLIKKAKVWLNTVDSLLAQCEKFAHKIKQ